MIDSAPFILYAFLGGLILNIMPCVLPVLSLKILGIIKHGGASHPTSARISLIATSLGIVVSFLALAAVTIGLKLAGHAIGWGVQFQEPGFILFLSIVVYLFALNLLGVFEIMLPHSISNWLGLGVPQTQHHSHLGDFLTGTLATLLATPCTAPFLSVAVSFALAEGATTILLIFLMMGIGMAFPYWFVALFPAMIRFFPKPGAWMLHVKRVLGILLLLTLIWLLWVFAHQTGLMPLLLFAGLSLSGHAIFYWLTSRKYAALLRWGCLLIILSASVILPLKIMHMPILNEQSSASSGWVAFDESSIAGFVMDGKTVFVDVTADWCTTCKFNKLRVLDTADMTQFFDAHHVIRMRADITLPNALVSQFLKAHQQYGIPFNIVFGPSKPDGVVLPTILTFDSVKDAIDSASKK